MCKGGLNEFKYFQAFYIKDLKILFRKIVMLLELWKQMVFVNLIELLFNFCHQSYKRQLQIYNKKINHNMNYNLAQPSNSNPNPYQPIPSPTSPNHSNQQQNPSVINYKPYQSSSLDTANNPSNQQQSPQIPPYKMTDSQFFNSLQFYKPLCYRGNGTPKLLVNKGWYLSLGCIAIMNGIFLLVIFTFLRSAGQQPKPMSQKDIRKFTIINIVAMSLINITYFLTQFLNPGIRNLSTISQQQYTKNGQYYCSRCNGNRTGEMEHCTDCGVCIEDLDHHCGFFSKCIGGWQKFVFYAFLVVMFGGFLTLIITMTSNLGL